jgi:hypothetical protein
VPLNIHASKQSLIRQNKAHFLHLKPQIFSYFHIYFVTRNRGIEIHISKTNNLEFYRKVAGSRPDEVNDFLSSYLILPVALGHGVYSASNRKEYQEHKNNVSGE